ncbi:hypothetical protein WJX84_007710, partial [Apatococcus fuscideae]
IPKVIMPNILREIRIQAELGEGHMNVINAKEVLLTQTHLALVMEFAAGASLTSYVAEKWQAAQHTGLFLTEDEARYFFRQFVGAVEYCHLHCVAHRDLKLDNTLLDNSEPPMIKLCDFGFAKTWAGDDANMMTHIGTPVYMSPELIHSRNGAKGYDGKLVDVWASGVLLIVMLLGTFPFDHLEHPDPNTTEAHLEVWLQQVKQKWSDIPHISKQVEKAHLSEECRDLLNKIFVIDEKDRISLQQIKAHPWYNKPLLAKHTMAERKIAQQQAEIQKYISTRQIDAVKLQARSDELARMVEAAAQRPQPGVAEPLIRINLRESAVTNQIASSSVGQLGSISEAPSGMSTGAPPPMAAQGNLAPNGMMAGQMHQPAPVIRA